MKLLFHCCCAPCALPCVRALEKESIKVSLFWYNPNIHPYTEYKARRDCLAGIAANENLELTLADEYGLRSFLKTVYPDLTQRCEKCYRIRLEKTAVLAAEGGFCAFSTSLLISPYQDHETLRRIGEEEGAKYGVDFLYRDFRPLFRESRSAARAEGLYMQKYCGCVFSEEERYWTCSTTPRLGIAQTSCLTSPAFSQSLDCENAFFSGSCSETGGFRTTLFKDGVVMGNRFFKKTKPGELVKKFVVKTVMERSLIGEGDRVLIAVSGGKDSSVLAWALSAIKPALKINYELAALHISSDFCACCKKGALCGRLQEWGIPFTDLFVPVVGRLKEGKKMNCYWCSTQRRAELLKYAVENGFNKLALGHHLDDIVETFFMNLCSSGTLLAMPVLLKYRKYPVSLIRPLALLEEKNIIACAAEQNILKAACTCPYGQNSIRRDMRERIAALTGGSSGEIKRRILRALGEGKVDYLTEK